MNRMTRFAFATVGAVSVAALAAGCRGNTTVNTAPADLSGVTVAGHGEVIEKAESNYSAYSIFQIIREAGAPTKAVL